MDNRILVYNQRRSFYIEEDLDPSDREFFDGWETANDFSESFEEDIELIDAVEVQGVSNHELGELAGRLATMSGLRHLDNRFSLGPTVMKLLYNHYF